jgi:hypothetical protein
MLMKFRLLLVSSILFIAFRPNLDASTAWTVYLRKAGSLRIGMSLSEVRKVIQDPKAFLAYGSMDPEPDDSECAYLESIRIPKKLGLMFQNGKLVRIDVCARGIRTASGAQVGDSESRIKRLYPNRIKVGPHHYIPESGHYLNYFPLDKTDSGYGMVFETDNGIVTSFRIGTVAAIALVEGCS